MVQPAQQVLTLLLAGFGEHLGVGQRQIRRRQGLQQQLAQKGDQLLVLKADCGHAGGVIGVGRGADGRLGQDEELPRSPNIAQ